MAIAAISGDVSATSAATAATNSPKQDMDSELFMKLLVVQLQNQDPSSPMNTNEMITQTTQLATMEKLTTMADTSTESFSLQMRAAASTLLGQTVSYIDGTGATITGTATSVSFAGSVPQVTVGGVTVALDAISGIATTPPVTTPTTPSATSNTATA